MEVLEKNKENDLESIIEELNSSIFNGEITDIVEVTYAYTQLDDGTFFNTTLFSDLKLACLYEWANKDYFKKEAFLEDLWFEIIQNLNKKITTIKTFLDKIEELKDLNEESYIKKELLIWSLKYVKNTLKMALVWLPFELEKAWLKSNLSKKETLKRISKIEKYERQNFWPKIIDSPEEITLAYEYLRSIYEDNKNNLTKEEQKEYKTKFLERVRGCLPKNYKYKYNKKSKASDSFDNSILQRKIHRIKYISILKNVFDILCLDFDVVEDERSSIYDGPTALHIPLAKRYDELTIGRVIELIWHEIESHSTNLRTNEKLIWNFRWAWNLSKEEGLAIITENLLNWVKLQDIGIPQHFPKVMMSELLSWKDLKRFLKLHNKIEPDIWYKGRLLRLKRNYPLNYKWWQHKDASYGRGVLEVRKFITDGNDVRDLYLWKTSIEDIPKAKRLMELKWLSYNDLNLPLFIWELVLFIYESEDFNLRSRRKKCVDHDSFMKYLKEKYSFIDFDTIEVPVANMFTKRKIIQIMETFRDM